nr:hypothetical protein [Paenibacillus sp. GM2]
MNKPIELLAIRTIVTILGLDNFKQLICSNSQFLLLYDVTVQVDTKIEKNGCDQREKHEWNGTYSSTVIPERS